MNEHALRFLLPVAMAFAIMPARAQEIGQYQIVALPQASGVTGEVARALILDTKNGHLLEWSNIPTMNGPTRTLEYQGRVVPGQTVNPIPDIPDHSQEQGAAESRAQSIARQVAACQQHNTGWEHVPVYMLEAHIADFNADCAELGIKTDCKVVTKHKPKPPGEAVDPDPDVELGRKIAREKPEVTC